MPQRRRPAPVSPQWAIVQLVDHVEGLRVKDLELDLHVYIPDLPLFIPAARAGVITKGHPLSTYCFAPCPDPAKQLFALERSSLVHGVLCHPATRRVQQLPDAEVKAMMVKESGSRVRAGDTVTITAGDWAGMEATVVAFLNSTRVKVLVNMWSAPRVLILPRNELQTV